MVIPAALAAALGALAVAGAGPVAEPAAPRPQAEEIIEIGSDRHDRLTVAVHIGDSGPFRFLIDTASEKTVLSRKVAQRLGLQAQGRATLIGIAGSLTVDTVTLGDVTLGRRSYRASEAPLLENGDLQADGIVGLDGLQDQRVLLDFENNLMAVNSARALGGDDGYEIVVRARRRGSQLIMTNALVDGVRADVVIDTGSQAAVANRALQRRLARRAAMTPTMLVSVTGQEIPADIAVVRSMQLGSLRLGDLAVAFVDAPPFAHLGLDKKPALFLGMSELRAFKRVAIDFATRTVLFDLPPGARQIYD